MFTTLSSFAAQSMICSDIKTSYQTQNCCENSTSAFDLHSLLGTVTIESFAGEYGDAMRKASLNEYTLPLSKGNPVAVQYFAPPGVPQFSNPASSIVETFGGEPLVYRVWETTHELDVTEYPPQTRAPPTFNGKVHAIPYTGWAWNYIYDKDSNVFDSQLPSTASDFFDTVKFPGKRGIPWWGHAMVLDFALYADGVLPQDITSTLKTDTGRQRAITKLGDVNNYNPWFSPDTLALNFASPDAFNPRNVISMTYSSRQQDYPHVWDGHRKSIDWLTVPKTSQDPDGKKGKALLKHILTEQQQETMVSLIAYDMHANSTVAKMKAGLLNLDVTKYPSHYTDPQTFLEDNMDFWTHIDSKPAERAFYVWLSGHPLFNVPAFPDQPNPTLGQLADNGDIGFADLTDVVLGGGPIG